MTDNIACAICSPSHSNASYLLRILGFRVSCSCAGVFNVFIHLFMFNEQHSRVPDQYLTMETFMTFVQLFIANGAF